MDSQRIELFEPVYAVNAQSSTWLHAIMIYPRTPYGASRPLSFRCLVLSSHCKLKRLLETTGEQEACCSVQLRCFEFAHEQNRSGR